MNCVSVVASDIRSDQLTSAASLSPAETEVDLHPADCFIYLQTLHLFKVCLKSV